jgi:serine protease Do
MRSWSSTETLRKARWWVAALGVGLSGVGCGGAANDASTMAETTPSKPTISTPPLNTAAPLPPLPAPETFDVAALAERVKPLVVNITTTQHMDEGSGPFDYFFGPGMPHGDRMGAGTGFIIDPAGYVITNEHVVSGADEVRVILADDKELAALVVGRDPQLDLALLKVEDGHQLPAAVLGSSEALRVGEHVLAVGNPFGLGHTVTLGIVSAKARSIGAGPYDDFIQTDASINPGNSGGPLFNWRGEVVGINTAIRAGADGIGFAIPVDALKDVLDQLRDKGHVVRGKLGLAFQPISSELAAALGLDRPHGALVAQVEPGSAAARAGIKSGDVIIGVDDSVISHAEELPRRVARNPPGSKIAVKLVRAGKPMTIKATLDRLENEEPVAPPAPGAKPPQVSGRLGIQVSDVPGGGVRVDRVDAGSPVRELRPGDIIVEMNGVGVQNLEQLKDVVERADAGSTALVKIRRGRLLRFAAVPIPK